ncbi:MAG: cupin domain-containing protein [Kiloniellales bacterium]
MSEEARRPSEDPALFSWLNRRSLSASVFFSGSLCGRSDFAGDDAQGNRQSGHLHLLRRGSLSLQTAGGTIRRIEQPSLILFAGAQGHRLETEEQVSAELVCAHLSFAGPEAELLLRGLPTLLVIPLDSLTGLGPVLERLFDEAFTPAFGQSVAVDLIVELLLVMLLRHCIAEGLTESGLLAGLADPRLARVLAAMHDRPTAELNIEELAAIAGMSRSSFAAAFKQRIGTSPGDYLTTLRLALAKQALLQGRPLKAVAPLAGYKSATALARAFQRQFGCGPRDWLACQRRDPA